MTFSLPEIQDPDPTDKWTIDVNLGSTAPFAKYLSSTKEIALFPGPKDIGTYTVKITLADNNPKGPL